MKSFKEFRRLFEIQSNRNNKNNHILTKRRIQFLKKILLNSMFQILIIQQNIIILEKIKVQLIIIRLLIFYYQVKQN